MGRIRFQRDSVRPTLIFNAAPLIYLAKVGLAARLNLMPYRLVTTEAVYREVVGEGVRKGVSEVQELNRFFKAGVIGIEKVDDKTLRRLKCSGIHSGEASVISLALKLQSMVVMDDQRGRQIAKTLGVKATGTPHIVLHMVKQKILTKDEAKKVFAMMVEEGWRCGPNHYSDILRLIDEA